MCPLLSSSVPRKIVVLKNVAVHINTIPRTMTLVTNEVSTFIAPVTMMISISERKRKEKWEII